MNILFPSLGSKIAGPEVWKNDLVEELRKNNKVFEVNTLNVKSLFQGLKLLNKSDVVHSYNQSAGTIIYLIIAKIKGINIIHTVHGNFLLENKSKKGLKRIFWRPFNWLCLKLADKVTFPSKYLFDEYSVSNYAGIKKKSVMIPNFISKDKIKAVQRYARTRLGLPRESFLIVTVTSFNLPDKARGVDQLIKEFNYLSLREKNLYLFIIGSGKLLNEYKQRYSSSHIVFLGFRKDALNYIKSCDLFAHYSFLDNAPIVLLEAMSLGKPIIAISTGEIKNMLGNVGLIKSKESELNLVKRAYYDLNLTRDISSLAIRRSENYDLKSISKRFIYLYGK